MMKTLGIAATTAFLAASTAVSAGISGGGAAVNGISGGGAAVNGISGGGAAVNGISGGGAELLVVGPVEAVNADSGIAVVLGQMVQSEVASRLTVGDAVAVFGALRPDGIIGASFIQSRGLYVPGATSIYLSGRVQKSDASLGRVVVNGVTVDLTAAMSRGTLSLPVGAKMRIIGTQPVSHGLVVVEGISGGGAAVNGISGGGAAVNGISGGGAAVNGISGGGAAVNGISGGGAAVNGISGGGAAVNGISGGGAAVNGISGGGAPR